NDAAATVFFLFTDINGSNFGESVLTVPANQQIGAFLSEPPFSLGGPFVGTFSFSSSVPISPVPIPVLPNDRAAFLTTTLPVVETNAGGSDAVTLPHFAAGAGWTTRVVLVNPGDSDIGGLVQFFNPGGAPIRESRYLVRPRSVMPLEIEGAGANIQ